MLKKYVRSVFRKLGFKLTRIQPENVVENSPFEDMSRLLNNKSTPVIFDIGANVGQTINRFLTFFPDGEIYSFEPGKETFLELSKKYTNRKKIRLENKAVGSQNTQKEFLENESPDMSSFLEIDRLGWGEINNKVMVDVVTIDTYCQTNGIPRIDILKSDTQGFELEVFKGALQMMRSDNIQLVYFEFIFSDMYKHLPSFDEIYKLLTDHHFRLVKIYDFNYQEGMLSWADMLFVNKQYKQ